MANTLLTPTMITREALRILHQKLNFIGTINRQYDDRFAVAGAKIGDTLQIRLPNRYTVRTGRVISVQDTTESKVDLVVGTQKGVDMSFTSVDLTLDLDDFAERILDPAIQTMADRLYQSFPLWQRALMWVLPFRARYWIVSRRQAHIHNLTWFYDQIGKK